MELSGALTYGNRPASPRKTAQLPSVRSSDQVREFNVHHAKMFDRPLFPSDGETGQGPASGSNPLRVSTQLFGFGATCGRAVRLVTI